MGLQLKKIIKNSSVFKAIDRYLRQRYTGFPDGERYPRGHYYSPLPDLTAVSFLTEEHIYQNENACPGIDLQEKNQFSLLKKLSAYYEEFNYSDQPDPKQHFHLGQEWFCHGDALILYAMIRHLQPQRIIEAGSGFSSALMLDTIQKFDEKQAKLIFIDPCPDRLYSLISKEDRKKCRIIQDKVQDLDLDLLSAIAHHRRN